LNERRTYVVAYDVRAPRRLVRVHRALTRLGYPLQYSVFAADFTPAEKAEALEALRRLLKPAVDDLRIYPVPAAPVGGWYGSLLRPASLLVPAAPAATLADRLARRPFWAAFDGD
jgi:CRISPR-associated protein Cas2